MRATARLDGGNPFGIQSLVRDKELSVLSSENVVGHHGEAKPLAQNTTQRKNKCCLTTSYGATNADSEGALSVITTRLKGLALVKPTRVVHMLVGMSVTVVIVIVMMGRIILRIFW